VATIATQTIDPRRIGIGVGALVLAGMGLATAVVLATSSVSGRVSAPSSPAVSVERVAQVRALNQPAAEIGGRASFDLEAVVSSRALNETGTTLAPFVGAAIDVRSLNESDSGPDLNLSAIADLRALNDSNTTTSFVNNVMDGRALNR
jgi:hypothetical protein